MRETRLVGLILLAMVCLTGATQGQLLLSDNPFNQDATTLILGCNGELSVNGGGNALTTLEIISAGNLFIPENAAPGVFQPPFDIIRSDKLFKLSTDGFEEVSFGWVLPTCTADEIIADFTVSGSYLGGGDLTSKGGGGPYVHWLPEPSSALLLGLGAVGLLSSRRKQRYGLR